MKKMIYQLGLATFALLLTNLVLAAPSTVQNPPPAEAFSAFTNYEFAPSQMLGKTDASKQAAIGKLDAEFAAQVQPIIKSWPSKAEGRLLKIEPYVLELRIVSAANRMFGAGVFAGKSWVLVKVKFTDAATGKIVADPEFYSAEGVFNTYGNDQILGWVANLLGDYLKANFDSAVGGLSGAPAGSVKPAKATVEAEPAPQ